MHFEFATASRIVFGAGALREALPALRQFGNRVFVVHGGGGERARPFLDDCRSSGMEIQPCAISAEPTLGDVREATARARRSRCDSVVAFGGGSVIDAAKAVAALIANPGDILDYIEVIGRGQPLLNRSAPCIAIPTTAGTGAEVTRNAVLGSPEHGAKASLRSPGMLPVLAIVDPGLTVSLPPEITAWTGMDALTQLIEPFVSLRANPITDAICRDCIPRVAHSLRNAVRQGEDLTAREEMSLASLGGGLALANAGLGAVHGLAAPIGGTFPAPHGAVCAAMLPHAMAVNVKALREREPSHQALLRFREIAGMLTGDPEAAIEDGIEWVRDLCVELQIPRLGHWGVTESAFESISTKAAGASSMKANPIVLSLEERIEIVGRSL